MGERVKVGDRYQIVRTLGWNKDAIAHSHEDEVTKVTAKRAYFRDVWFALDDEDRVIKPAYLDYVTRAVPR